jgi:hypothetical protein
MDRLEDSVILPVVIGLVIGLVLHFARGRGYFLTSVVAAIVSGTVWMVVLSIDAGAVSNIWPIAWAFWIILQFPVSLVAGFLPILLRRKARSPDA